MVLQEGYPKRKRGFTQQAFNLRLQSYLKSPQTSIKLLSPKGSSFTCRTENLMPKLFFFRMFAPRHILIQEVFQGANLSLGTGSAVPACK